MGSATVLQLPVTLEVIDGCFKCGVSWAVSSNFIRKRREDKGTFFCPNGHEQAFTQSETDRLRRELEEEKARAAKAIEAEKASRARAWEEAQRQTDLRVGADRRASAARGQVTKIKNRIGNGVCPCCHRTFQNVMRHMATKHPGYKDESADA